MGVRSVHVGWDRNPLEDAGEIEIADPNVLC